MVLTVVVLLGAVAVLVVVLLLQPRVPYVAVRGAPLGDAGSAAMEAALRDGMVSFRVDGEAQTRWKVAGIMHLQVQVLVLLTVVPSVLSSGYSSDLSSMAGPSGGTGRAWRSVAAVVLFMVLAVVVLLGVVAVLVVVLLLQPRAPYVAVRAASLYALVYGQTGALDDVQVTVRVEVCNGNAHSAAYFSRLECCLAFAGATLAVLRAYPFHVPARGVLPLAYVARAQGAPLGDAGSAAMEAALHDGVVPFRVEGEAQTRWKVAGIIGVDQWTRPACQLRFFWPNGTVLPFRCSSKSKFLFF
ncbi:late embryogenesis abundant protein [Zea mays]|uniref:Late embryogenesis abundant protein n=2 Tax=Zea mays TaxID=4577 RepID=A0A1D6FRT0_MAIZE|nr:late embryogenesis abundant protein [Zea mays]